MCPFSPGCSNKGCKHDLRHTVGTYVGQAGLNAVIVRDLLGDKALTMTGRYAGKPTNHLRAASDQVATRRPVSGPAVRHHHTAPSGVMTPLTTIKQP